MKLSSSEVSIGLTGNCHSSVAPLPLIRIKSGIKNRLFPFSFVPRSSLPACISWFHIFFFSPFFFFFCFDTSLLVLFLSCTQSWLIFHEAFSFERQAGSLSILKRCSVLLCPSPEINHMPMLPNPPSLARLGRPTPPPVLQMKSLVLNYTFWALIAIDKTPVSQTNAGG